MKSYTPLQRIVCVLLLSCASSMAWAGEVPLGVVAQEQAMLDMANGFRLMCVAAHPDDEDGASLSYYRKKFGAETHAVIATRGEGGQNEIGPELYNALGVIRTHEMQAAADIEGAQLHFLNMPEFGYSKTPEETFEIWGKDTALLRLVKLIREIRPHVIITHHGRMKDHGHHQAIGATVIEAFDVAGDENAFPELLDAGLQPWQVSRLYIRNFNQADAEDAVVVPINELDPLRGKTYAEIAAEALDEHKSQGMGFFINYLLSGTNTPHYELVKEAENTGPGKPVTAEQHGALFAGLSNSLEKPLQLTVSAGRFDARQLSLLSNVPASVVPDSQRATLTKATNIALGFRLELVPEDAMLTMGQETKITAKFRDFGAADAQNLSLAMAVDAPFYMAGDAVQTSDVIDGKAEITFSIGVDADAAPTVPHPMHLFDDHFLEHQIHVNAIIEGQSLNSNMTTSTYVDIAPPMGSSFVDAPYLVIPGVMDTLDVAVQLTNRNNNAAHHNIRLFGPAGWKGTGDQVGLDFTEEDESRIHQWPITLPTDIKPGDYEFGVRLEGRIADAKEYPRNTTARVVDLVVPQDIRVGVVQSYDDTFVTTLKKMGVAHETIEAKDFSLEHLQQFTSIIVDIRAYLVRQDLVANNATLLKYVKQGGTLLVNYQKTFEWRPELAPYPINVSRNRVTREEATMTILEKAHPLFTTPNTIGAGDWDGWRQERGLYFPNKWDSAYTPLVECHDPDETIPPGSLLVADYGEGKYLYTALGWYRQLRELHPGALRVFANMLAL